MSSSLGLGLGLGLGSHLTTGVLEPRARAGGGARAGQPSSYVLRTMGVLEPRARARARARARTT